MRAEIICVLGVSAELTSVTSGYKKATVLPVAVCAALKHRQTANLPTFQPHAGASFTSRQGYSFVTVEPVAAGDIALLDGVAYTPSPRSLS